MGEVNTQVDGPSSLWSFVYFGSSVNEASETGIKGIEVHREAQRSTETQNVKRQVCFLQFTQKSFFLRWSCFTQTKFSKSVSVNKSESYRGLPSVFYIVFKYTAQTQNKTLIHKVDVVGSNNQSQNKNLIRLADIIKSNESETKPNGHE